MYSRCAHPSVKKKAIVNVLNFGTGRPKSRGIRSCIKGFFNCQQGYWNKAGSTGELERKPELKGEQRATEKSTHEASKNSIKQRQPKKSHTWDQKYNEARKSMVEKEQSGTEMKWRSVLCSGWWWIDEAQRTKGDNLQEEHMKSCAQLKCRKELHMENPRIDDFINFIWTNVSVSQLMI